MQILLVEDDRTTRLATAKLAETLGHRVHAVETAEEAMTLLSAGGVELLFTDLQLPKASGIDLTKWVRSRETDSHLYVLLLTSKEGSQVMRDAFAAGIDDFVRKGASADEIGARFRVAERIVRVEKHMRTRAEELESALRRLDISAAMRGAKTLAGPAAAAAVPARKELLSDLRTWKNNETTLKTVLAENIQGELVAAPVPDSWADGSLSARICLTDVEHKVEMEIILISEAPSAHKIACNIFGDPEMVDAALVADTMLELANGTMGVFKTAFSAEDYRFTAGIPKPVKIQTTDAMLANSPDRRVYAFACDGVVITALLGIREKLNRKVKVGGLKEGMVIAEPITRAGAMLLKAGTRLSEVLIERLHHIDRDLLVELSDPSD